MAGRSDLSAQLVHFTRSQTIDGRKASPVHVLMRILGDRRIRGSSTATGFIVGNTPAACFQDTPLYSAAQNIYADEQYRRQVPEATVRYVGVGLMFSKAYVYERGGRPAIYESTELAKRMLPAEEWWRIVGFDLSEHTSIVDWTHEREWRVPMALDFDLGEATVVVPNQSAYRQFVDLCQRSEAGFLTEIRGLVSLGSVFF